MKAVIVRKSDDKTSLNVEEVPIPYIGPNQVLIRNKVLGLNLTDWMHAQYLVEDGAHLGCDGTGIVEEIGDLVRNVPVGARRGYFLRGGMSKENAAFADFTVIDAELTFHIPDNVTFEQAATLPIPFFTALQALYKRLKLPTPKPVPEPTGKWLLIYSGGTSVGQYAIQLAKHSGLKIITTASPSRAAGLKELGADVVIDYHSKDVVKELKEATGDEIEYALDCYGTDGPGICHDAISTSKGGSVVTILAFPPEAHTRSDVQVRQTSCYSALAYGDADVYFGPNKFISDSDDREFLVKMYKSYPDLLASLNIKFTETQSYKGLGQIEEALAILQSGKVPGKKLVVHLE